MHPLTLGCISSYYYLHHTTVGLFREKLTSDSTFGEVLWLLCVSVHTKLFYALSDDIAGGELSFSLYLVRSFCNTIMDLVDKFFCI